MPAGRRAAIPAATAAGCPEHDQILEPGDVLGLSSGHAR